jgi:hypothetical protein
MLPAMNKKVLLILIMTVSLFAASANGAPMAYSVNSDGQNDKTWDSLYLIDLAVSGSEQRRGPLFSGAYNHFDTEGLAFSPDGTLWGVDDDSRILFPINTTTGAINFLDVIPLPSFPTGGGNDFGMTFTCDNTLYLTSVVNQTLYHVDEAGSSTVVGSPGALGVDISAITAIGNPTRLYGLGNGNDPLVPPSLYSIDTGTGVATPIGPLTNALPYNEGGLAFDANRNLWAITDRSSMDNQPSQVLSINIDTGMATVASTTIETGFESLAITPPTDCEARADIVGEYYPVPSLSKTGLLVMITSLILAGMIILRRRVS